MKTFSMSQAGANIAFPFSVNAPFSVKAIQIDNVTCATIIIGTKAFTLVEGGDITIVPPYSARAVLVQDIGSIWISSNGSITFSSDRLGITLYDSEVQPFVSAYALANGPMIIANQTLFQQGIALGEIATPVNPAASTVDLYAKVDGHFYLLPAGGIEHRLLDETHNHVGGDGALIPAAALAAEAWTAFTPNMGQGAPLTLSQAAGHYKRFGNLVIATVTITINSAGGAGVILELGGLPVASRAEGGVCWGTYLDAGTGRYVVTGEWVSGTGIAFIATNAGNALLFGQQPAVTAAAGDQLRVTLVYEAA